MSLKAESDAKGPEESKEGFHVHLRFFGATQPGPD